MHAPDGFSYPETRLLAQHGQAHFDFNVKKNTRNATISASSYWESIPSPNRRPLPRPSRQAHKALS